MLSLRTLSWNGCRVMMKQTEDSITTKLYEECLSLSYISLPLVTLKIPFVKVNLIKLFW